MGGRSDALDGAFVIVFDMCVFGGIVLLLTEISSLVYLLNHPLFIVLFICYLSSSFLTAALHYRVVHSNPGILAPLQSLQGTPCPHCAAPTLVRSHHCKSCGCVARFDHHCFWVNNCIGEGNHARFLLFLWAGSAFIILQVLVDNVILASKPAQESNFIEIHIILLAQMLCTVVVGFFLLGLTAFHTYLAATGLTTYEVLKADTIPYMTLGMPFFEGPGPTLVRFFTMDRSWPSTWTPRRYEGAVSDVMRVVMKVVDNEYYSCC
ncbi:DHHC palmitoyltransferase [Carpediemonas membranifera]|uniref:Palmitoyltransferase n=1 Tax=Carpediemonas membranifera TaxID=201153 RepID=A0A8J6BAQ6_9EUKA|nr:DHHC palmitoyltransferase [Carpediemonas membranifera]|eukprot:KAG9396317.1 DHHC palmitoyltransferase [Carpediemonas membranifera]